MTLFFACMIFIFNFKKEKKIKTKTSTKTLSFQCNFLIVFLPAGPQLRFFPHIKSHVGMGSVHEFLTVVCNKFNSVFPHEQNFTTSGINSHFVQFPERKYYVLL